jgi:hypothetical protein
MVYLSTHLLLFVHVLIVGCNQSGLPGTARTIQLRIPTAIYTTGQEASMKKWDARSQPKWKEEA